MDFLRDRHVSSGIRDRDGAVAVGSLAEGAEVDDVVPGRYGGGGTGTASSVGDRSRLCG